MGDSTNASYWTTIQNPEKEKHLIIQLTLLFPQLGRRTLLEQ
jgi:hypothetical protein